MKTEIVEEEYPEPVPKDWVYLIIILLVGVSYNWQKYSLAYTYGYQPSDPAMRGNPTFEIAADYTDLPANY